MVNRERSCQHMAYVEAIMHQIRSPHCESLQRPQRPLAGFQGPTSKGKGEENIGEGRGRMERDGNGKGE